MSRGTGGGLGDKLYNKHHSLGTGDSRHPPPMGQERPLWGGRAPHGAGELPPRGRIKGGWRSRIKEAVTRMLAEPEHRLRRWFTPCAAAWEKSTRREQAREWDQDRSGTGSRTGSRRRAPGGSGCVCREHRDAAPRCGRRRAPAATCTHQGTVRGERSPQELRFLPCGLCPRDRGRAVPPPTLPTPLRAATAAQETAH